MPGPPEIFLQLVQWQCATLANGSVTSKRTPPQRQLPRSVSTARAYAIGDDPRVALTGHATVFLVSDVGAAIDYYRDALGFDVDVYERLPDHYGYAWRDGCHLHFARYDGVSARPNSAVVSPDMFDAYFWVDDVDELHAELVERGAEIVHGPVDQGYGLRELRVRDPDGYILAFGRSLSRADG